ncbi:MAG: GIY-YIG nuclease family protein [Simkaniaceae bacterium]|nr:GIY-YIG nuclease family protein [Simkaniaceae bacterium]
MKFCTYILYSRSKDRYYIGHTDRLKERLAEHNYGHSKSTKTGRPWIVKYIQRFATRSEAMRFEHKLKRMKSRQYLEDLICSG